MWFLWIFGRGVEDLLGHAKYLFLYFACGIAGALLFVAAQLQLHRAHGGRERRHRGRDGRLSGQVSARPHPHSGVHLHFHNHDRYSGVLFCCSYWFAIQFFSGIGSVGYSAESSGGVAWFAHVGGFLAGMALMMLLPGKQRAQPWRYYN